MWRSERFGLWLLVVVLVLGSGIAQGQEIEYKAWQCNNTLADSQAAILGDLRNGTISDRQRLDNFFENYYFSRWTNPDAGTQLNRLATEFARDTGNITGPARQYLLAKAFSQFSKMASDPTVFPAARINAMLMLGKLAEQPGSGSSNRDVPYAGAISYLMKEYERADNPEWLRLAALIGVVRHASLGVADDTTRNETAPQFFRDIIAQRKPAAGDAPEVCDTSNWFRLRAIEGLQGLRETGKRGESVESLLNVMEDITETSELRYAATCALGDLPLKPAKDSGIEINPDRITAALFAVTSDLCRDQIAFIDSLRIKDAASGAGAALSGMGSSGMGSSGLAGGASTPQQVKQAASQIVYAITAILNGLGGIRAGGASAYRDSVGVLPLIDSDPITKKRVATTIQLFQQFLAFLSSDPGSRAGSASGMEPGSSSGRTPSPSMGTGSGGAGESAASGPTFYVTLDDMRYELLSLTKLLIAAMK